MADQYVSELAALSGLQVCPAQGPWEKKEGIAVGPRDGYIVAVGPGQSIANTQASAVNIMLRFAAGATPESIRAAIAANAAVQAALDTPDVEKKHANNLSVGQDFLIFSWPYSFKKPSAEKVTQLATGILEAVKSTAPAFGGKCEMCKNNSVSEIMLYNGIPGYYCASCQENERMNQELAGREYEAKESNLVNGIVLGLLAALAGSLAWGFVAYWAERIFLWGAVGIGFLVGWAFFKGSGKVENLGRILVAVLTVASVLFGDAIFFTLVVMKELGLPFSMELLGKVLENFWVFETEGSNLVSVFFGLFGAGFYLYSVRKPKFHAMFEPLRPAGA